MRISLLLQREPFGAILEQTLATFLEKWRGQSHQVCWREGRPNVQQIRQQGLQPWLCNIYLNAIFVPEADPRIFDPIRREFSHSPVWWRRPVQSAYVALGTSRWGARWLAQASLGIAPALPNAERLLIVAGNHKIRILDYAERVCYNVRKIGLPSIFMKREISARRLAERWGLPVPLLESVAEDGAWFKERYLSGTPVNRLGNKTLARQAVQDAARALSRLYKHTRQEESLDEYLEKLVERLRAQIVTHPRLDEQQKQSLLHRVESHRSSVSGRITTALTHGDFQPANILVNEEGVWLIDWEYAARRQIGYDVFVYTLQARSAAGLEQRLRMFCEGKWSQETQSLAQQLGIEFGDVTQRKIAGHLFALEEMETWISESYPRICTVEMPSG